jgi:hypothetical protein
LVVAPIFTMAPLISEEEVKKLRWLADCCEVAGIERQRQKRRAPIHLLLLREFRSE